MQHETGNPTFPKNNNNHKNQDLIDNNDNDNKIVQDYEDDEKEQNNTQSTIKEISNTEKNQLSNNDNCDNLLYLCMLISICILMGTTMGFPWFIIGIVAGSMHMVIVTTINKDFFTVDGTYNPQNQTMTINNIEGIKFLEVQKVTDHKDKEPNILTKVVQTTNKFLNKIGSYIPNTFKIIKSQKQPTIIVTFKDCNHMVTLTKDQTQKYMKHQINLSNAAKNSNSDLKKDNLLTLKCTKDQIVAYNEQQKLLLHIDKKQKLLLHMEEMITLQNQKNSIPKTLQSTTSQMTNNKYTSKIQQNNNEQNKQQQSIPQ